jgi:hypothetical protein
MNAAGPSAGDRTWLQEASLHHSDELRAKLFLFMFLVRRHFSWLIGAWFLCQFANVAAAPLTFCCQNVASVGDEEECCPGLLPGQVCPMHHAKQGERTCQMRSTCTGSDAALVALAGGIGVLPPATAVVNSFALGDRLRPAPRSAVVRAYRPESPPPRA